MKFLCLRLFSILLLSNISDMELFTKDVDIDLLTFEGAPSEAWGELERHLRGLREKAYGPKLIDFVRYAHDTGITRPTICRIEEGGSYSFTSFWKYLGLLNVEIILDDDDQAAASIGEFGQRLEEKRKQGGLTMLDVSVRTHMQNPRIIDIEKGRGYTKQSFLKYMSMYPKVKFSIKRLIF